MTLGFYALLLVALFAAGCSARTWACGPEFPPWASAKQWPEPICRNGPR